MGTEKDDEMARVVGSAQIEGQRATASEAGGESFQEQINRLSQMAADDSGETWDLSVNDRRAISALLWDRAGLLAERADLLRALLQIRSDANATIRKLNAEHY